MEVLRCNSLRRWREEYMSLTIRADFEPGEGAPFNVSFKLPIGLPGIAQCRFSPGTLFHTPEQARNEPDAFLLAIVETGGMHTVRCERQFQLHRGEATLWHVAQPSGLHLPGSCGGIGIIMPRAEFEARGMRPDGLALRRLSARCEALGLLKSYIRSAGKSGLDHAADFGAVTPARDTVRQHIYDLAALAVSWSGAVGESQLAAAAQARLQAALDDMAAHSGDPQLTVETVARRQGVSPRYLQRLLKSAGRSYTATINEMRLQKVFMALTAADRGERPPATILDIAMQAGFSDLSYFTRLFRARFGDTPGCVRASGPRAQAVRFMSLDWSLPSPLQAHEHVSKQGISGISVSGFTYPKQEKNELKKVVCGSFQSKTSPSGLAENYR